MAVAAGLARSCWGTWRGPVNATGAASSPVAQCTESDGVSVTRTTLWALVAPLAEASDELASAVISTELVPIRPQIVERRRNYFQPLNLVRRDLWPARTRGHGAWATSRALSPVYSVSTCGISASLLWTTVLGVSGADTVSRMGCGSRGSEARPRLFRDISRGSDQRLLER